MTGDKEWTGIPAPPCLLYQKAESVADTRKCRRNRKDTAVTLPNTDDPAMTCQAKANESMLKTSYWREPRGKCCLFAKLGFLAIAWPLTQAPERLSWTSSDSPVQPFICKRAVGQTRERQKHE